VPQNFADFNKAQNLVRDQDSWWFKSTRPDQLAIRQRDAPAPT